MAFDSSAASLVPTYPLWDSSSYSSVQSHIGCTSDYRDKNVDSFSNEWNFGSCNGVWGKSNDNEAEKADDIRDRLPVDPFGMDIKFTFTRISGWIEDFENIGTDYYGFALQEDQSESGDQGLLTGPNLICRSATRSQPDTPDLKIDETLFMYDRYSGFVFDRSWDCDFVSDRDLKGLLNSSHVCEHIFSRQAEDSGSSTDYSDGEGGAPHDALFFSLAYLGIEDLLSVERVCRSLSDAVRNDPLLWRSIHINQPLNGRITDDSLIQLTSRAQGSLECLNILMCVNITASGLKRVFDNNPRLRKLSIPGCVRIGIEGLLRNIKTSRLAGTLSINQLRVGGLSCTEQQFQELKFLVSANIQMEMEVHKPHFYCPHKYYLSCGDDCAIDIEICPRCQGIGVVYDCPAESCKKKHDTAQICRACILCIQRCIQCGCCIENRDYVEVFSLEALCLDCLKDGLQSECTILQPAMYHICFFG